MERLLPWRQFPVDLRIGVRAQAETTEVVSRLAEVPRSDSEFNDFLGCSPAEALQRFQNCRTPLEMIQIARELA